MSNPDNPSAFPNQPRGQDGLPYAEPDPGMTLRDWFAGQALANYVATKYAGHQIDAELLAEQTYRVADAMLAERAKAPQP